MERDELVSAPASGGFEDDDEVDLSFAGPESVATAPWPTRLLDVISAYLPLLMMAVLALGTWWLVRNAPNVDTPREAAPLRHEADYTMTRFVVQRFGSDGAISAGPCSAFSIHRSRNRSRAPSSPCEPRTASR